MALNQEEIRIRAGLDYSKVTSGITDIRAQVFKLANDVPKKMFSLLKANVYMAAAGIITELLPTWQEIWDKIYNTGPDAVKRSDESNQRIKDMVAAQKKAAKDLAEAKKEILFGNADDANKAFQLMGDEQKLKEQLQWLNKQIVGWREFEKVMKPALGNAFAGSDTQKKIFEGVLSLQTQILEVEKQRVVIADKISDLHRKMQEKITPMPATLATPEQLAVANLMDPLYGRAFAIGQQVAAGKQGKRIGSFIPVQARKISWDEHMQNVANFGKPMSTDGNKVTLGSEVVKVSIVEINE